MGNVNNKALEDVQVPGAEAVKENSKTLQTQVNDDASSLNAESNNKNGKALDGPQLPTAEAVKGRSLGNIESAKSATIETNPVLKKSFPLAEAVREMQSNKLETQKSSSPFEQEKIQKSAPKSEAISLDDQFVFTQK